MKKILFIFGTRPEAIKLAPLIRLLKREKKIITKICITSQHKEMLIQVLELFKIKPDYDLDLMSKNQSLSSLTSKIILNLEPILKSVKPDLVLLHGDTTTTLAGGIAAYYQKIKIGHVEAGLRTNDIYSPWPEEVNRKLISSLTDLNFAPTQMAKKNLLKENIDRKKIFVTGNTVIDALLHVKDIIKNNKVIKRKILNDLDFLKASKNYILVTGHRRENFGDNFFNICNSLKILAEKKPEMQIIYSVHLNPYVKENVHNILSNIENIFLIKPQSYLNFVYLMLNSRLILSDSGGIQEEAPSLKKIVLVMREKTERQEGLDSGWIKLVGTKSESIVNNALKILDNYEEKTNIFNKNPYGDGKASKKILTHIKRFL